MFGRMGIEGGEGLSVNGADVLEHVQNLRDIFVDKVLSSSTDNMGENFIAENARFIAPGLLETESRRIRAKSVVIAAGSAPVMPSAWRSFGERVLTTDSVFELEQLPRSLAIIGLGVIGLELGQAFSRLGVQVTGIEQLERIGNLDDPEVNKTAIQLIGKEFPLWLGQAASIEEGDGGKLQVTAGEQSVEVDKVLVAIGRQPNFAGLDVGKAGIELNERGVPAYNPHTMQIGDLPVFVAGDVDADRPLLHEAADEGRIAGTNACLDTPVAFRRKVPLFITFSSPNIVQVGKGFSQLDPDTTLVGSVEFGMLGRALIMGKNRGTLRMYADKSTGRLLGAQMAAPYGEHLGHLLAWSIEQELTIQRLVQMPFYHPVIEEILQSVLRDMIIRADLTSAEYHVDMAPL
jgi:dihydrolipoamide dehydrogenase